MRRAVVSFYRFLYFNETDGSFPCRLENVIARDYTERQVMTGVNPLAGFHSCEKVGPLATDTSLLERAAGEINWLEVRKLVLGASQETENGASCMFFDCRQIALLGDPTVALGDPATNASSTGEYFDAPLETLYLASRYDRLKNVPIAPVYLLRERSFGNAITTFLSGVTISEFGEVCLSKCDRMLDLTEMV
jgi:hypothetical protein